jgi:hypothetical protein
MGTILPEGATLEPEKFTVPFCVPSESHKDPFTYDEELAAVFALSELDRAKAGGLFLKQPEEKIVFISKIGYPLWLVRWSKNILVFDGLNRETYTLPHFALADVKIFMDDLRGCIKTRESYVAFLKDHLNYFVDIQTIKELTIHGLMGTPEFLNAFKSLQQEATRGKAEISPGHMAPLKPIIDDSSISSVVQQIEDLHVFVQNDIGSLNKSMQLLNKATQQYIKELNDVARVVREEFDLKIKAEKDRVTPIINDLKDEYNVRITGLTKNYESQRAAVHKEIVRLQKEEERTEEKIKHYKEEANKQADEGKPAVEKKYKEKINEAKKHLSQIEDRLKEAEDSLKDVEERRGLETIKLKDELEVKTKEANVRLAELEAARDSKLLILKQEKERMEAQSKQIIDHTGKSLKLREADIDQFTKFSVSANQGKNGSTILYIPFYVTCYQVEQQKRYMILPPSAAATIGLTAKLRGVFGGLKIKALLAPRFKALSMLTNTIHQLTETNAVFENELHESGVKANILDVPSYAEEIKKGMAQLKAEGWFSDKEFEAVSQKLL